MEKKARLERKLRDYNVVNTIEIGNLMDNTHVHIDICRYNFTSPNDYIFFREWVIYD